MSVKDAAGMCGRQHLYLCICVCVFVFLYFCNFIFVFVYLCFCICVFDTYHMSFMCEMSGASCVAGSRSRDSCSGNLATLPGGNFLLCSGKKTSYSAMAMQCKHTISSSSYILWQADLWQLPTLQWQAYITLHSS